ncbi:MAG: hypothetical protein GC134_01535 [Proteobacteria bacterium]|nr:hypothetical protein [Pseudomonadota bacterium]
MSNPNNKLYFAHPMSMYGTAEEALLVDILTDIGFSVINPGDPAVAQAFGAYRDGNPNNYMQFFVDLCNACEFGAFCTFPDDVQADDVPNAVNRVGAGVVTEIESFWARGKTVFWLQAHAGVLRLIIVKDWTGFTCLDVPQTRAMLKTINPNYKSGK